MSLKSDEGLTFAKKNMVVIWYLTSEYGLLKIIVVDDYDSGKGFICSAIYFGLINFASNLLGRYTNLHTSLQVRVLSWSLALNELVEGFYFNQCRKC